ncbi:MAG: methyltransferase domain-containing protein [Nitrospirae bacterium]|nr:MAG: methyltransferase domain-containing protein [Nitrospirota bacterium]
MTETIQCYACGAKDLEIFYQAKQVPAHSCLLMSSRAEALNYPKGDVVLGFCRVCGFIENIEFDPTLHEYSSRYEETQSFSPTFNVFHQNLAKRLIERYHLYDKDIIEIGCGKGEFITLLCELGKNRGIGFDPSYIPERNASKAPERLKFITDFYSEKYTHHRADFVCCKMTLEHIQRTADFVSMVRRAIGNRTTTIVFFQVPDVRRILQEVAFWDIYYEHCSYFSLGSLSRLFQSCGFNVLHLSKEFNGQYLVIEASLENGHSGFAQEENDVEELAQDVQHFKVNFPSKLSEWRKKLDSLIAQGRRVVIWGSGSKAVAYLTALKVKDEIEYVVDINPYKHGKFLAGTGHEIVSPTFLKDYRPDVVIVMNPAYQEEIKLDLAKMEIFPDMVSL